MSTLTGRIRDHSDEYSATTIQIADYGALITVGDLTTAAEALETHLNAISLGTVVNVAFRQQLADAADERPASPYAQRELGLRFFFHDDTDPNAKGNFTIAAPDLAALTILPGTDLVDITQAPVAAFVAWFEAEAIGPGGNSPVVDRAVIVGRSN